MKEIKKNKEFDDKTNIIMKKTTRALDKLSKEYNKDLQMFSGIKQKDGSWNIGTCNQNQE